MAIVKKLVRNTITTNHLLKVIVSHSIVIYQGDLFLVKYIFEKKPKMNVFDGKYRLLNMICFVKHLYGRDRLACTIFSN